MFGWLKKGNASGSGGGKRGGKSGGLGFDDGIDYAALGVDPSVFEIAGDDDGGDEGDVDGLTADDIDDPKLLRELNALLAADSPRAKQDQQPQQRSPQSSTSSLAPARGDRVHSAGRGTPPVSPSSAGGPPVRTPPQTRTPPTQAAQLGEIDIDKVHAELQDPHKDVEVEFTEEDENDPELLAELSKVTSLTSSKYAPASTPAKQPTPQKPLPPTTSPPHRSSALSTPPATSPPPPRSGRGRPLPPPPPGGASTPRPGLAPSPPVTRTPTTTAPRPTPQPLDPADIDIDVIHAELSAAHQQGDVDVEVELTEEEEKGGALLDELAALTGVSVAHFAVPATTPPSAGPAPAPITPLPAPTPAYEPAPHDPMRLDLPDDDDEDVPAQATSPTTTTQLPTVSTPSTSTPSLPLPAPPPRASSLFSSPTSPFPPSPTAVQLVVSSDPVFPDQGQEQEHEDEPRQDLPSDDEDPAAGWLESHITGSGAVPQYPQPAPPTQPAYQSPPPVPHLPVVVPPRSASGSLAGAARPPPVGGVAVLPGMPSPPLPRPAQLPPSPASFSPPQPPPTNPLSLPALVSAYKSAALAHKRASDVPGARMLLMKAKEIEAAVEGRVPQGWVVPPRDPEEWVRSQSAQQQGVVQSQQLAGGARQGQQQQLGQARPVAQGVPGQMSSAQPQPPRPRVAPSNPPPAPMSIPPDPPVLPRSAPLHFTPLVVALHRQAQLAHLSAAYYLAQGDKQRALFFHQRKKRDLADMKALEAASVMPPGKYVDPTVGFETVRYEFARVNQDLALSELEVVVVGVKGLRHTQAKGEALETTLVWDVGYPVDDEGKTKPDGRGETRPVRGEDPQYNEGRKIALERGRPATRWAERRRVTVEVWFNQGFFWGKSCLGKGSGSVTELLNKCELELSVPLADPTSPRRLTGAVATIRLRLRNPLSKPDMVQEEERWTTLEWGTPQYAMPQLSPASAVQGHVRAGQAGSAASAPVGVSGRPTPPQVGAAGRTQSVQSGGGGRPVSPQPRPVSPQPRPVSPQQRPVSGQLGPAVVSPQLALKPTPPAPSQSQRTPSVKPPASQPTGGDDDDLDTLIATFDGPDSIVSNEVMMAETAALEKEIVAAKAAKDRTKVDELEGRKMGVELKMQVLAVLVQTGKLEMPDYSKQLTAAIASCKTLALKFKRAGRLDYAKRALERMKIMEKEVAEVEQMMKEDAEEG
ncbi:hypothetical protein M427DRAFT_156436 [Gonapodya prolifera JEL478]|uniref:C2 domain-containing protein n=1 Tax=Gonapodya prolifera (strain JEL478) TaxID=1344416 RepID=A0A139AA73_GONPJ|nr:hypothetical protein M427DRAFT_156436 [Gonapodya prolifera JEL478]|eukprot:KXS13711.1 hypothetical protein M427DRAFT_156436 [Gonapodya prolifera JEL478]